MFQVHGGDANGRVACRRKRRRQQLAEYFANLPCYLIGLEACGGAHSWARQLSRFGHTVRLMAPQFVKPYVKSNKNDANAAEAICEAVNRPTMRFVPTKCVAQQDWQMLHRVRRAATSISADCPSGNAPTTRVRRRTSRMMRSSGLLVWICRQWVLGKA